MKRIICDSYYKKEKHLWSIEPENPNNQQFNRRILAVNHLYEWLYNNGVLEKVSFWFRDYEDKVYFALDVEALLPYHKNMEHSKVTDAALAVHHIFDEKHRPCRYSGAIQLGWIMATYRDNGGCIGSSWECDLVKMLQTRTVQKVLDIQNKHGVKEAVLYAAGDDSEWNPLPDLQKNIFLKSLEKYADELDPDMDFDHLDPLYIYKLNYIYQENHRDLALFKEWLHCESILDEPLLTFDEYQAIADRYNGNLQDVNKTDITAITSLKETLEKYRSLNAPITEGKLISRNNMNKNLLALIDEADGEMLFLEPEFNTFSNDELKAMLIYVAATPALEGYVEFDLESESDRLITIYKGVKEALV